MAKVHPNAAAVAAELGTPTRRAAAGQDQEPEPPTTAVLTVWRKSLLFNCDGFTVYDADGDLAFRVDCYARRHAEVVLMDAAGAPLLTVRRKRLSLAERWHVYHGDAAASSSRPPVLSVRRHVGGGLRGASGGGKTLAHVVAAASSSADAGGGEAFVVEGSYGRRACAVRDARGDVVAEVRRKEAVGDDVFRLVVSPSLGAPLAMGLVVVLDEMFAGRGSARSWLRLRGSC
ncbi:hypothetical protein BDA96_08G027600 [Sorghum bicolor]|uniref:Protein LURP-one-related 8 n=1 Tax=Sorghum bicolor TaxID=4558 RepID=A0A921U699_SORBI|nr:hypothetical protein BDA96_08G027600 [Sorghum bicolor]